MNMKKIYKSTIKTVISLVILATLIALPACNDNPDAYVVASGKPAVSYVRLPDALRSDSLVTHAFMGTTIALVGENLRSIKQVWFNDQKAVLNTSLITPSALIVVVPNTIPSNVTSKIYMITASNDTVKYDFGVDVPSPLLNTMDCEYVADGGTAVINGNFFLPVDGSTVPEVYFTPNIKAEVLSMTLTRLTIKVPVGAAEGPISVKSRYGTTRSFFRFRDTSGLISNFSSSSYGNPWGLGGFGTTDGCDGQYLLFQSSSFAPWSWLNNMMWVYSAVDGAGNKPIGSGSDLKKVALRFEANVPAWSDEQMCIWFTPYESSFSGINVDATYAQYHWKPYLNNGVKSTYKTNGWITVTIPLSEFNTDKAESVTDRKIDNISNYTNINLMVFGAADGTYPIKICIDNLRVVNIQ
jgi:hypothetical protein